MEDTTAQNLIRQIQGGLFAWYKFHKNAKVLYIGNEEDAYVDVLLERNLQVQFLSWEKFSDWMDEDGFSTLMQQGKFDYVISVEYPERSKNLKNCLLRMKELTKPKGHLLLGMNNRLGARFLCGDRDPYTDGVMDGVEGYLHVTDAKETIGRCYSKSELKSSFMEAGMERVQFFSVLSDLKNPVFLYADGYFPNEDVSTRIFPTYGYPRSVFMEEACLHKTFVKEGIFHELCNAYFIDYSMKGEFSHVLQVTGSMERGKKDALITIIRDDKKVEKRAAYPEGQKRIEELATHDAMLQARGIQVVGGELIDGAYIMPFMEYPVGQLYLKELLHKDKNLFLKEMDHFRDTLFQASELAEEDAGDGEGALFERAFYDMVPLNSFYVDGEFVFFDQEFCIENYPANVMLWRMIASFYFGDPEVEQLLPMAELIERYHLKEQLSKWQQMEWDFLGNLKKDSYLVEYHKSCWKDVQVMMENRKRMQYSHRDYQRFFVDIFKDAEKKKLVLFGAGAYTKDFLSRYQYDYPVNLIVDNNEARWGQEMDGVSIVAPETLLQNVSSYKVIICVKKFEPILQQLESMGIADISVYEKGKEYSRIIRCGATTSALNSEEPKKYHIGYVAGAFDMFHVGHVNLLRKAKEMCDFLIVGVLPDEGIYRLKQKYPIIPCEDRVEMIRSCKYADRVEELPLEQMGIPEAYELFHFDAQFSGDDHAENESWLASREYLRARGSDIVFFNYTEKVSSSMLRDKLKQ